jgi:fusion and transport protein UGO1
MASHNYHQSSHSSAFSPPNPLRPYYIPPASPSVDNLSTTTSSLPGNVPTSYGIIQDFQDYSSDYLESPSISEAMRSFLDQAILKYTAVLISQPFEVAKTVLQCQYVPKSEGKLKNGTGAATADEDDDEGDDEENGCDNEEENKSEEENPWQFDDVRPGLLEFLDSIFFFFFGLTTWGVNRMKIPKKNRNILLL